ncbi:sigma-70 family RNA polymerase sigma factor [Glaciimonas sp. CA11.2]|uniref:sigma-70 family RNA polymerase sigma factor n=1 Tax=Glaciimonas sp. CA11.2 TaxID=3048601 RepID=UPI002AB41641|nr:sigma-70 family RNA polymerase sigma factor [Glaciimonas sp. CA11.2]MDY7544740.1 sigma-70 family RNA polymerase sigma factor [Glaciimonas sp. CA11.2]MEB0163265.1 sigma-70 family RNA polymerase sigma factor [Glaciimonas sp. CA11.2]
MSSKIQRAKPALSLVQKPQGRATPDHPERSPDSRPDGTLDWSVYMARTQGGDGDAYCLLLEQVTPYLRVLASRQIENGSDVEDVVQDILLTVHTVRHTYDPARPFGPWLVTIANRRIIDKLRRQGRCSVHEEPLAPEHETFSTRNLHEEAVDASMLRDAVGRLPARQRDAIQMLKLEEMSLAEAASASGISVSALKVATHRALKNLRKLIDKRGGSR